MDRTEVLIVGAGPTGLVLALSLLRAGVVPRIIDAKSGTGTQSRALAVQARTLEYYQQLGIADDVVAAGVQIREIQVRNDGRVAARIDVDGFGAGVSPFPFVLCFPQDEHEKLLEARLQAAGVQVEWGTELVAVRDTGEAVVATLSTADGGRRECTASYVCGCDGPASVVRRDLGLDFAGATSDRSYFVADVDLRGYPTTADRGGLSFCLSGDDFLLVLPARNTGTHRLTGLLPRQLVGRDRVSFDDVRTLAETATGAEVSQVNWFSTYRVQHRVADHFRSGRTFVLGDAGHLHSPLGGQGMNTGIADAVNLAWKLGAVVRGRLDPSVLDTYEPERIAFARELVATTDRLFGVVTSTSPAHRLLRRTLFLHLVPRGLRLAAVRRRAYRRISQTTLEYRASVLSAGVAGRVHGGDRLPWVPVSGGRDNYGPLHCMDWQLHVYGQADDDLRTAAADAGLVLHRFDWTDRTAAAGFRQGAAYLIRPDGYVALADPQQSADQLRTYLTRFAIRTAAHPGTRLHTAGPPPETV